ncbi:MAG: metalloregulator ArsR/SmtB family transcription factor [Actinobacteria bacterium]|nr:metalloregulator ArsR/SmtB family transcription factor [Actinomycetota bacterium]
MADRVAKEALFDRLADVAKALGNGRRAELVDVLAQGERSVEVLASEVGQSMANTSHHLQVLARAGLVASRRDGSHVHYRLSSERVGEFWSALRDVAAHHVAGVSELVDAYLGPREGIATITRDELISSIDTGKVVVLDVRPLPEYEAGHIPSAISIDPTRLYDQLRKVPRDAEVVAYCRGPYCAYAYEAIRSLASQGVHARRLEEGFPEWRRAGLPVAIGTAVSGVATTG